MDMKELIIQFWKDVVEQNALNLKRYFSTSAMIKWHNTNELFTVDEYIIANCEYPGKWNGVVERIEIVNNTVITVARINSSEDNSSFHATSFFEFESNKIIELNEYWGDDGKPPKWRIDKNIGQQIIKLC
jgi:hypothetical protein